MDELIGKRFGSVIVTGMSDSTNVGKSGARVTVVCDCGATKDVRVSALLAGSVTTCATKEHRERDRYRRGADVVGQRFGLLEITSGLADYVGPLTGKSVQVLAQCDCGTVRRYRLSDVVSGSVSTCGGDVHRTVVPTERRWKWSEREVHTYAIRPRGIDAVKIGKARDVNERLRDLQVGSASQLEVFAMVAGDIESDLHSKMREDWMHGEWFAMTEHVLSLISEHMQPVSIGPLLPGPPWSGPRLGRSGRCKVCGESGHYAKTCRKQFAAP